MFAREEVLAAAGEAACCQHWRRSGWRTGVYKCCGHYDRVVFGQVGRQSLVA
jgi:hypothetical protein